MGHCLRWTTDRQPTDLWDTNWCLYLVIMARKMQKSVSTSVLWNLCTRNWLQPFKCSCAVHCVQLFIINFEAPLFNFGLISDVDLWFVVPIVLELHEWANVIYVKQSTGCLPLINSIILIIKNLMNCEISICHLFTFTLCPAKKFVTTKITLFRI